MGQRPSPHFQASRMSLNIFTKMRTKLKEHLPYILIISALTLFGGWYAFSAAFPEGIGGTGNTSIGDGGYPLVSTTTQIVSSSTPTVVGLNATSTINVFGTGTSTFSGSISLATNLRINRFASCNLDTDVDGNLQCGTDAGGGVTINSGTANRVAYYSAGSTVDSFNGLITGSDGTGSTTIASNLTVTSIYASSTARITGALTLDAALTVAGVATFNGATTLSTTTIQGYLNVGVLTATTSARLDDLTVTGTATFPASSINTLALTDGGTIGFTWVDAEVSDTLTASDLVAGSSVVSNAEVDNDLTISGGVIDGTIIGGTTAAAGTFTNLTATASSTISRLWVSASATTSQFAVLDNLNFGIASTTWAATQTLRPRDCGLNSCRFQKFVLQANLDVILNSTSSGPLTGDLLDATFIQGGAGTYTLNFATNNIVWQAGNHATPTAPTGVGSCLRVLFQFWGGARWVATATSTGIVSQCPAI